MKKIHITVNILLIIMETTYNIEENELVRLVEKVRIDVLNHFKQNPKNDEEISKYIEFTMENYGINEILRLMWGNNDEYYEYDRKKIMRNFWCDIYAEELGINDDEEYEEDDTTNQFSSDFTFQYTEEKVLNLIRKEVHWRKANIERNINIYKRRQENKLLDVIGKEFNLEVSSISEIDKKVKGAIIHYKGKLFESQYSKHLEKSKRFDKVELLGASGEPDIVAHKLKEDALYVFSLKNLAIKKHPYYISEDLLKVEYKYAYENSFTYKEVHLILVVFNNLDNSVVELELDYSSPKPVIL